MFPFGAGVSGEEVLHFTHIDRLFKDQGHFSRWDQAREEAAKLESDYLKWTN